MANVTGSVTLEANGKAYTLWLGMSVLAEIQDKHGDKFEELIAGIEDGKMPSLSVVHSIFLGALQRFHKDEADRWLVDDLIAQNQNALGQLMAGASPDPEAGQSRGKAKAAA